MIFQIVYISNIFYKAQFQHFFHHFASKSTYIHGISWYKIFYSSLYFSGTYWVGTFYIYLSLFSGNWTSAYRTFIWFSYHLFTAVSKLFYRFYYLRYYLSSFFYKYFISYSYIFSFYFMEIMKTGSFYLASR